MQTDLSGSDDNRTCDYDRSGRLGSTTIRAPQTKQRNERQAKSASGSIGQLVNCGGSLGGMWKRGFYYDTCFLDDGH